VTRVWIDVSCMPPRVIICEGRGPDKGALRTAKGTDKRSQAQRRADTHRHSHSTDSGGMLSQESITGFWHMPEKHNRILLGPDTGRDIKENQER